MINSKALYDIIKYNHFSLAEVASILCITPEEFKNKLEKGQMLSNEIESLLHFLKFPFNPMRVFFDTYNYENPEKIDWVTEVKKTQSGADAISYLVHRP